MTGFRILALAAALGLAGLGVTAQARSFSPVCDDMIWQYHCVPTCDDGIGLHHCIRACYVGVPGVCY